MKHFYLFPILLFSISTLAQNPLIVKTVGGTNAEPIKNEGIFGRNAMWNGKVFYQAQGAAPAINLAVTDGTTAGTVFVKNIGGISGATSSSIYHMVAAQSFMYITTISYLNFTGSSLKVELWRSDGTDAGTVLLKSFDNSNSNNAAIISPNPSNSFLLPNNNISGDVLYFCGYDISNGTEPWTSDGTAAGTLLLKDLVPGTTGSSPRAFSKVGNKILFTTTSLWQTDGTAAGTTVLSFAGGGTFGALGSTVYKGKMYFYASEPTTGIEIWSSDGTVAGTTIVSDANPGSGGSNSLYFQALTFMQDNNYMYFVSRNNNTAPHHIWRTDGTTAGTFQLTTASNAIYTTQGINTDAAAAGTQGVYYISYSDTLYKTDGTIAGTTRVAKKLITPRTPITYKNAVWFISRASNQSDNEPWRSDGLTANTNRALDVYPSEFSGTLFSSNPVGYFEVNNKLYFFANNNTGRHLFQYTGDMTFNGSITGGRWRDSANWNSMMPPGITDTVNINSGTPNALNINGANAYAGTLILQGGSVINLTSSTDSLIVNSSLTSTTPTTFTGNGALVLGSAHNNTVMVHNAITTNHLVVKSLVALTNNNATVNNALTLNNNGKLILGKSNLLMTGITSTITASPTNYIVTNNTGKLQIDNIGTGARTGNVTFPIGTNENYNPVTISNTGTADQFAVRVQDGISNMYSGENTSGGVYTTNAVNATWMISEANAGGSNATVTLQWNQAQELQGFNRVASQFGHYFSGSWQLGSPSAASGSSPFSLTNSGISSFSPFGILNSGSVLPVNHFFLSVRKKESTTLLSWVNLHTGGTTTIERSTDGRSFQSIAVPAASATTYNDLTTLAGKTYYRLKATGRDGGLTYSNVAWIDHSNKATVSIYPTIFTGNFIVQQNAEGKVLFQLYNKNGQLLIIKQLTAGTNNIDASLLPSGAYVYKLVQGQAVSTGTIIKR